MLKNFDVIDGDPMPVLENYSGSVDPGQLPRSRFMAATLANSGVHAGTGKRTVLQTKSSPMLSIMATCGVRLSGSWLYEVGLPPRAGSAEASSPSCRRFGLAIFSPRLTRTHSVRGIAVCQQMSREFGCTSRRIGLSSLVLSGYHRARCPIPAAAPPPVAGR